MWSCDPETKTWQLSEVSGTSERLYEGDMVLVVVESEGGESETIQAMGNHPFWVEAGTDLEDRTVADELSVNDAEFVSSSGGRWIEARWLRVGDTFLTKSGKSATVVGLTIRLERIRVYNLNVSDLHNYAVGEIGVLVHNRCGDKYVRKSGVYVFRDAFGNRYVGQAKDIGKRLGQHLRKHGPITVEDVVEVAGGKVNREMVEQFLIQNVYDGLDRLINVRNPFGLRRFLDHFGFPRPF